MTKFLLTTAGVAAVLTLLSGGRRYQSESFLPPRATPARPQGPRGRPRRPLEPHRQRPFPNDGAYLRALADVHDYCPDDFMRLCTSQGTEMEEEPADEGLVAPVRRLATLLIDVRAVDASSSAQISRRLHSSDSSHSTSLSHHATGRAASTVAESTLLTSGRLVHAGQRRGPRPVAPRRAAPPRPLPRHVPPVWKSTSELAEFGFDID